MRLTRSTFVVFVAVAALVPACRSDTARDSAQVADPQVDFSLDPVQDDAPPSPSPSALADASTEATTSATSSTARRPAVRAQPAAARPAGPQSSGRVHCPSGRVVADLDEFDAEETGTDDDPEWRARASGTVTNQTSAAVKNVRVRVLVHASDADTEIAVVGQIIGRGSSARWRTEHRGDGSSDPSKGDAQVSVAGWSWADPGLAQCPT